MRIVAHRGASGTAPENTLAALRRGLQLGASWAEVDVQRTSDGVLVLVHDETWRRTTGMDARISDVPWSEVRRLDAGGWFSSRYAGEPPPRLEEVLSLTSAGLHLDLEIKSPQDHPGLGLQVVEAVRRAGAGSHVLLTCFDAAVIEQVADAAPDVACGYLASHGPLGDHPRVRALSLHDDWILAEPDLVSRARASGRSVWAWTVDDPQVGARLEALGVESIITNHPERFLPGAAR
jgi:glycerophosphoryl diester phosphodiesterase